MTDLFPINEINVDFANCHKLIYGYPKSGKTTLAAQMSDAKGRKPLFVMTEDGLNSLRVHNVRVTSWDGFKRLLTMLENNKAAVTAQYSTIVVDVLGDLDLWAATYLAEQKRIEHISDLSMGKGWKLLRDTITENLGKLMSLAPVTYIAHTSEKEVLMNGEKIKTQAPSLSKACMEFVMGKVDAVMWIDPANSKKDLPKIVMRPSAAAIAGCRQGEVAKDYVYDPKNPGKAYTDICAAYRAAQETIATNGATTPQGE